MDYNTIIGQEAQYINSEIIQESGGSYAALGPPTRYGRAIGKYQILPGNIASWARTTGCKPETPSQFLHDPANQDCIAISMMDRNYRQYGAAGAAAVWYSGQPDPTSSAGNPPVWKYVQEVLGRMASMPTRLNLGHTPASTSTPGTTTPTPPVERLAGLPSPSGILQNIDRKVVDTAERVGLVLLGAVLIVTGLFMLHWSPSSSGKTVAKGLVTE